MYCSFYDCKGKHLFSQPGCKRDLSCDNFVYQLIVRTFATEKYSTQCLLFVPRVRPDMKGRNITLIQEDERFMLYWAHYERQDYNAQ